MNNIWTIKDGNVNHIELEDDIEEMINYARCPLTKKYLDEGYSLIVGDDKNMTICINENISNADKDSLVSTLSSIKNENNYLFKCFNYLEDDNYESMFRIRKNFVEEFIGNLCREKLDMLNDYYKNMFFHYRDFDLKCSLQERYMNVGYVPSSYNSGFILINENERIEKSLTYMSHEEAIIETTGSSSFDLYTNKNTIVFIVAGRTGMIFVPDVINDYQKEELSNIRDVINSVYSDTYIDVVKVKNKDDHEVFSNINDYFSSLNQKKKVN